jgi:hypothetical protein
MYQIIEEKIEALRLQLVKEAFVQGNLTDEKVVVLSQQLDNYIVINQKLKAKIRSHAFEKQQSIVV